MPDYSVYTADTVQCAFYTLLDNRLILNSTTFKRTSGSPTAADAQLLADQLGAYWRLRIHPLLSSDSMAEQAIVVPLNFDFTLIRGTTLPVVPGGIAGGSMPNNVGFRIDFKTLTPGIGYRGWTTVCGIPRAVVTKSRVALSWAEDMLAAWVAIGPLVNGLGWEWVVTSTHLGGAPRAAGVTTNITHVEYKDLQVDSCRHRLPARRFS